MENGFEKKSDYQTGTRVKTIGYEMEVCLKKGYHTGTGFKN